MGKRSICSFWRWDKDLGMLLETLALMFNLLCHLDGCQGKASTTM
jgi:hypothetical protein